MTASLKLTRQPGGIELRRGRFEISVDSTDVGSLEHNGTVEIPVEPGRHTLRIRAGRYSSKPVSFDAADGEVVNFHCHGAEVWPRYVASLVKPDLAISLKRECMTYVFPCGRRSWRAGSNSSSLRTLPGPSEDSLAVTDRRLGGLR